MEINLFSSKIPFNNNIAILESKIIYFCLRSNFRGSTTLNFYENSIIYKFSIQNFGIQTFNSNSATQKPSLEFISKSKNFFSHADGTESSILLHSERIKSKVSI